MSSHSFSLDGKTALITGGTSGMGLATARRFVDQGARVVITGRRSEGAEIAKEIGADFAAADLTQPEQITEMVDAAAEILGGIDILISNAGAVVEFTMIEETSDEILQNMFELNSLAHYRVMRAVLPHLHDGGSIVFTATLLTGLGNFGETAYGAAKSSLLSLVKGVAMELAPRGIRVNAISPGATEGAMWPEDHPQRELIETLCPMGRFAEQDEIASLCQFLSADACRFITGANIPIDGGITAGFAPQMLMKFMGDEEAS
ncbi:MAG: SDR family oxidoreductase [Candidatus Thiodiazotropha sp.]